MSAVYVQEVFAEDAPTIYIVGDSTGCHYAESADATYYYKRVGFGDKIADYLKEGSAEVVNLALSGRSSKSFLKEDNYQTMIGNIGAGEVVEGDIPTEGTTEAVSETTTECQPGDSFVWWADENAVGNKLNIGTYTVNGANIILHNTNSAVGIKNSVAVDDKSYNSYKIGKESEGGYIEFVPAADGWATFYIYLPSGKNYTLTNSAGDSVVVSDMIYTGAVTAGNTYKLGTSGTGDFGIAGISFTKKEPATVTTTITVNSADGNVIAEGSKLIFTNDSTGDITEVPVNSATTTYNVELSKGFTYTVTFTGTDTMIIGNNPDATATVTTADVVNILDIMLIDAAPQTVTGTVYGPAGASTTIQFGDNAPINVDILASGGGTYVTALKPGTYDVAVGSIEGYSVSSLSTNPLVVVNNGDENYKNVLYTKPVDPATGYDIYVDQTGNYYSDKDNVYTNLTDAMAAIESSGLEGSKKQRFTVHVAPGFYEEQFFVNADYVSIIADSDGDGVVDGDVIVSWYYGIDYMYYSIDPATGFYSEEYAVDKHTKTTCTQKWGSTMIVSGSNFYSEGITYQNTFNLELRDAELADGVENDGSAGSPGSNTTYDRTQENADVRLTTATERAAALVIDGQQAEFYNCEFLGSQDTVYTGNYNHYFKDCLLAGETDYIFGNGGTTIFDDCELQWIDYHYEGSTSKKAGYIAVPRGTYIFRNCEITSSGLGLNVTTGEEVVTEGYYGRPWGNTAEAIFMNCETNGLILDAGWKDMSGVNPEEVEFREYNNTSNGEVFYSNLTVTNPNTPSGAGRILTAEEAEDLKAENDWKIFSTWLPSSHIPYVGNPNIYKFDFTTGNVTSPVKDENGVADLTHNGIKYHGTTYGGTMGNGGTMTIYAGSDAQSMDIGVNSSYNQNKGSLELYKNDVLVSGGAIEFANTTDNEMKTFTVTDVKAGDIFTIKYVGTDTFYCGNVTVTSFDGTLTTAPVYNIYNFDFTKAMANPLMDDNGVAEISHEGFGYHGASYGFNSGKNAWVKFTVATAGEASISVDSSYQENNEVVTLKNAEGMVLGDVNLVGITSGTIKADLVPGEYTLEYAITEGATRPDGITALSAFYSKGLTITMSEEGTLAPPAVVVPTTTYEFDLAALNDNTTTAVTGTVMDKTGAVPMTIGGDVYRHTGGHGLQAKNGSSFSFTLVEAGTVIIEMPFSYLGSTSGTIDVTNAMGENVGSYTLTATTTTPIAISLGELQAGTYAITNNSGKDLYVPAINITTTGVLGDPSAVPAVNNYEFDLAALNDNTTTAVTGTVMDKTGAVPMTIGGDVYRHTGGHGLQAKNGSSFSFTLVEAGTVTIEMPFSYLGSTSGTIDVTNAMGENVGSYTLTATTTTPIAISLEELQAGTYAITNNSGKDLYVPAINITTTGVLGDPSAVPVVNTYEFDFAAAAEGHLQGDAATGDIYDKNNTAVVTLGNNVKYHGTTYGFEVSDGAEIGFTLSAGGNTTITIPSSYQGNAGSVGLYKDGVVVGSPVELNGITNGTISGSLEAGTYTLKYSAVGSFYTAGITIVTEGVVSGSAVVVPTTTYEFDFAKASEGHGQFESASGDVLDNNGAAVVTLGNNVKYHGAQYGFVIGNGGEISFTVAAGGNTNITIPSSYGGNAGKVSLYKGDVLIGSTDNLAGVTDGTISANLEPGEYTLRYEVTSGFYTLGITIETEGQLAAFVPAKTYNYDFTQATESYQNNVGSAAATNDALAKITLDATNGKFGATGVNGYQINAGSVIGFSVAGKEESLVSVAMDFSYVGENAVIEIFKTGSETPIGTITVNAGSSAMDYEFMASAGDYEIRFNNNNQYVKNLNISVPEEAMSIGARPDVRGDVNSDDAVNILDAIAVLRNVGADITTEATLNSDYDLDGEITNKDAAAILRAGLAA